MGQEALGQILKTAAKGELRKHRKRAVDTEKIVAQLTFDTKHWTAIICSFFFFCYW